MCKYVELDFVNKFGMKVGMAEAIQRRKRRELGLVEPEPTEAEIEAYWILMARKFAEFAKGGG